MLYPKIRWCLNWCLNKARSSLFNITLHHNVLSLWLPAKGKPSWGNRSSLKVKHKTLQEVYLSQIDRYCLTFLACMPLDCERKPRQLEGEVTARMWSSAVLPCVLPWHSCLCHCITALLPANFLIYHPIPIINIFVRSDGFRTYLLNLIYITFEFYHWNVFILDKIKLNWDSVQWRTKENSTCGGFTS